MKRRGHPQRPLQELLALAAIWGDKKRHSRGVLLNLLDGLNESQSAAVTHGDGPILILAGAGSGKTRVVTHRMAHLIYDRGVDPRSILAVTFTNKAAAEMKARVARLLSEHDFQPMGHEMWVSTFHSACVRILRSDISHLGYPNHFTIYDDSDQLSVVKAVLKELNLNDSAYAPKAIQGRINKIKNEGIEAEQYNPAYGGPFEEAFCRIFRRYSEVLRLSAALDFADLILKTVTLFATKPQVLAAYNRRFPYVFVDEYQDTNRCQYRLMKLLAGPKANICAVGDEDQSIYRWRGADITNILNFEKDFPNAAIFKLEENYRSTKNIIEAASHVIAYNTERRDKKLFTRNEEGEKIQVFENYDEHDEAQKVVSQLHALTAEGVSLNEIAIFYRTNAQSRVLEDFLRTKGLHYQIFGGLKFYDRLEVKDSLAYLKLLMNPADDVSFRRIINVPGRGIGAVSLEKFTKRAAELGMSNFETLEAFYGESATLHSVELGRSAKSFQKFHSIIKRLQRAAGELLPSDLINQVLEDSGYRKSLVDENTIESQARLENLAELRQSIVEYELRKGAENPNAPITLQGFLEEIALVSDFDRFDPDSPAVKMMTIHMAKGLEFDYVFIVGLEEELFPNIRPWEPVEPGNVEEERRLFYVGMTRAKKRLWLFFAKNRVVFGNPQFRVISRFIEEIPRHYLELQKADYFGRRRGFMDRRALPQSQQEVTGAFEDDFNQVYSDDNDFRDESFSDPEAPRKGSRVVHPVFGEGVVQGHIGKDKIIVNFVGRGVKKLSLNFVQMLPKA